MKFHKSVLTVVAFATFWACKQDTITENKALEEITAVQTQFAPDKRVALFAVDAIANGENYVLKGESNLPEAIAALKANLTAKDIAYIDSIAVLPAAHLEGKTEGLITISVANLRSNPKHSAELATQATLGTPVHVLKEEDSWYLIQTPDGYLAWVDDGGIVSLTTSEMSAWKAIPKLIYTKITGNSYTETDTNSQVVSDLVAGAIFELVTEENNFYKVKYPDGRMAFVAKSEASLYQDWLAKVNPSQENLVATSKQLMGLPYLWGGTSSKGVDCSGFTKTIYFLNGMVIPRDASQQVHTGEQIDEVKDFSKLLPGDLLFFGRQATDSTAERVIHVGMWIGNNEFIHSAGRVKINSMDVNAPNFDAYNHNRYLRSKRLVTDKKDGLINLTKTPVFND